MQSYLLLLMAGVVVLICKGILLCRYFRNRHPPLPSVYADPEFSLQAPTRTSQRANNLSNSDTAPMLVDDDDDIPPSYEDSEQNLPNLPPTYLEIDK
eukprot:m.95125 g.95125  ORF g.95125 m.95125 type:complete len:97 (+) comp26787_c0_seq1:573-863(+)